MTLYGVLAVAIAFLLDWFFMEPPTRAHPVVWFGKVIAVTDREWSAPRQIGLLIALGLPAIAAIGVGVLVQIAIVVHPLVAAVLAGIVLFTTTSMRMLLETATDVSELTETNIETARKEVRALAGRDASSLSPGEVRSAVAESLSENLADGLVASLFAFAICAPISLPLAAAAATWVKAVNTLDSMLGYRSKPVGWASARLDDAVMWIPARLSAVFIAVASLGTGFLSDARSWAHEPPSPNSGWPMATLAAALDTRFEKPGVYTLNPRAQLPTAADVRQGVSVVRRASLLTYVIAGVFAWF
ncbi:adenosylcobinamide-phosphate synthase [Haladaptatus litoreus]|uniref:Probable cobalamin biosynthesis protein CobD n=1 Tax=Haladaptatus litoreus TaxID=553468 RepID=A0A1N7CTB7_9EURY|nr:adenosylcobinamide-phosphate synthase CbiB [Haladaptatus litoreus]SIR66705.1 adenosylcobinamide-phosphate synthase [Haladaptatus litoreus]